MNWGNVKYRVRAVPDALLTLLRWCLLALVYLFFFRVLQATWFGAMAPANARAAGPGRKRRNKGPQAAAVTVKTQAAARPTRLLLIEPDELAGAAHPINDEVTIGRAAGCQITLDDTYISQLHARISLTESGLVISDLGSTNGTYLNRQRVTAPVVVGIGDRLQVGSIVMELQ